MERNIPQVFDKSILFPLLGHKKDDRTAENFLDKIYKHERKVEESLIDTFSRVNIHGTVKTDPFSLPYQKEIKVTLMGESYMNGPYEVFRLARKVLKQLLADEVYKIRFYVYMDIDVNARLLGKIDYYFRYYEHDTI